MEKTTELQENVLKQMKSSFDELESIWDHIGYDSKEKDSRANTISDKIQQLLLQVIKDENQTRIELESKIESKKSEISEMCQKLRLPPYFPLRGSSSFKLVQMLDEKLNELLSIRNERITKSVELSEKIDKLCLKLDITDKQSILPSQSLSSNDIPSDDYLQTLLGSAKMLEEKLANIVTQFNELRDDIIRISNEIEYSPKEDFEISFFTTQEPAVLNDELLEELQMWRQRLVKQKAMLVGTCNELREYLMTMWQRLRIPQYEQDAFLNKSIGFTSSSFELLQEEVDRCQSRKWENMSSYLETLKTEANDLQKKCFIEANNDISDVDSEEAVNNLEQEIDRLRHQYEQNKVLYEAVAQYNILWEQYLEVEAKIKDPATLSNRGGILLKTEKEKKRLLKELPRVVQEVADTIHQFECNMQCRFLIDGREFVDYVEYLKSEFKQKDVYKSKRLLLASSNSLSSSPRKSSVRMS